MNEHFNNIRRNLDAGYYFMSRGEFEAGIEMFNIVIDGQGRILKIMDTLQEGERKKQVRRFIENTQKELSSALNKSLKVFEERK